MKLNFTRQFRFFISLLSAALLPAIGYSQVSITAGTPVNQNFDGMSSTSSTATLPTNWKVSKSSTARDTTISYASAVSATERIGSANISGTAANGIYNYGSSTTTTDRAVGGLSSASASKTVNIYAFLKNDGAGTSPISSFTISYDVEKYRAGQNPDHQIQLYYSTNGSTFISAGSAFNTSFPADGANAGYSPAPGATASVINETLTLPSNLASGGNIYFLWSYSVGTGNTTSNAQGLGIDNISITGNSASAVNPVPTTTSISPNSATEGNAGFTLTVNGTNFISSSEVNFNGVAKSTTFVSATQLTASIPASDINTAGSAPVTVTNPAGGGGGGGTSNSQIFTINPNLTAHPAPVLTSISPSSATAGDAAFTLTASGTSFVSSSVINFNGVAKTTTYVNATTLTATISAAEIDSTGTFPVTVSSPTTNGGGGTSGSQTFTVNAPPVTYISIEPGTTATENFTIGTSGTSALPLGWFASKDANLVRTVTAFSSAGKTTENAAGDGMSTTATNGIYNYGAGAAGSATDRAVGGLSSGSAAKSVNVYAYLRNTSATNISSFTIGYDVEKYRNGLNAAGFRIQVFYSTNGTNWIDAGPNFLTAFGADGDNAGYSSAPDTVVPVANKPLNVSLAPGSFLYLAWNYSVTSGSTTSSAQALAIDNVSITANGPNPVPAITALSPNSAPAGSLGETLTVTGSNFVAGSEVNFNGVARPTSYVSATELTAEIPASDLAVAGSYPITVSSPTTGGGGGTSGSLTFTVQAATSPVINVSPASLTAFNTTLGTPTAGKNYQVSGAGLTGNIVITAPAGFQVSLSSGTGYGSSLILNQSGGSIPATTIYARYNPTVSGTSSGNIAHTSTGATTKNVAVTGSALNVQPTSQPALSFDKLTATSVRVFFAGGNGNKRLLVVKKGSAVNAVPVDGTTYAASTIFGNGTQIGTGNYVVFAGTSNYITVSGLSGNTTYHFSVFAYNDGGTTGGENYLTTLPGTGIQTTGLASPVTYTWNGTGSSWDNPSSWTPARTTPQTNDVLVFDGNVSPTPVVSVDFVSPQTIGQLRFVNEVTASLRVASNKVLNLDNGVSGPDLFVQANSQLVATNSVLNTSLTIQITSGETGQVYGDISFTGMAGTNAAAHRLLAASANSLVFENGSVFTAGDKFSGNAFGTGTGNSGPLSVWFKNGSNYIQRAGSNPFGGSGATTVTTFAPESNYLVSPPTGSPSVTPSLSGRTYGNLEIDDASFSNNLTGSGALVVNNLTIFAVITFNLNLTNSFTLTGNLIVEQGAVGLNTTQVIFGGTSPQIIGGSGGTLITGNSTNMVINAGAKVSLERDMTMNGPLTVNGTFTMPDTVTVTFGGSAVRNIGGAGKITLSNAIIGSAGVSLSNSLNVSRLLILNGNVTTNGQTFTLLSDANGTAMVVNNGGAVVAGTATVQRYVTPNPNGPSTSYHHYASPVVSAPVSDLANSSFAPVINPAYNTAAIPGLVRPFPTVFGFRENRLATFDTVAGGSGFTGAFFSPGSLAETLTPGRGYSVLKGRSTLDLNGTLNNGTVPVGTLTYSGPTVGGNAGWHLLGNPYPSPIDWDNVNIPANMDNAIYVYQADSRYYGTYRAYVKGGPQPSGYSALTAGIIPMMQAFYVRVNAQTSFAFENAHRVTTYENPIFYRTGAEDRPVIQLDLVSKAGHADALLVYAQEGATVNADSKFDAYKIKSGEITTPNLFAITPAQEELAISGIPVLNRNVVIPLGAQVGQEGEFTFKAEQLLNIPAEAQVYLEDKLNGTMTPLTQGAEIKVKLKAGSNANRFALRIAPSGKNAANILELAIVYPNPTDRTTGFMLQLNGLKGKQVTAQLYNSIGKLVETKTITVATDLEIAGFNAQNLAKGFYTLKLTEGNQTIAKKIVVN